MRIAILHNAIHDQSAPDEKDVLVQVETIAAALYPPGHSVTVLPCDLNLGELEQSLNRIRPDLVFNLAESLAERGALIHLVPFLLEALEIPFTGNRAEPILLTSNKIMAKTRLRAIGLPTPTWLGPYPTPTGFLQASGSASESQRTTWIIKSVWEHASIGLDEEWLLKDETAESVLRQMPGRARALGGACFAEAFIDGREFNLSLLDGPDGPVVLPPAEICFAGYGPEKPRIVGYRAKWDADSFEYSHTPRRFDFPASDRPLLRRLESMALSAWHAFGLSGYARVDFRVDEATAPWILEINTNPCLSPDAGFPAAIERAGIAFPEAIARLIAAAMPGKKSKPGPISPPASGETPLPSDLKDAIQNAPEAVKLRLTAIPPDVVAIGELVETTGFFNEDEVKVAMELVQTYLDIGEASGYRFIFAEQNGRIVGYTCYGPIACTATSYDLYWIAVHPHFQGRGLGGNLLAAAEQRTREAGGTRMYAETSNRDQYVGTRAFYERQGYRVASLLADFYSPGDDRATYCKVL